MAAVLAIMVFSLVVWLALRLVSQRRLPSYVDEPSTPPGDVSAPSSMVFETPPELVAKVGGVTISTSIFIRKLTPEDTARSTQEFFEFFGPAFWRAAADVDAPLSSLRALLPDLSVANAAGGGGLRSEQAVLRQHLPDGSWHWPAYEAYAKSRDDQFRRQELDEIADYDLPSLLARLTVKELRALGGRYAHEKPGHAGRKKAELIAALSASLSDEQLRNLANELRADLLAGVNIDHQVDYAEMSLLFCRRVSMMAFDYRHKQQAKEIADRHPMWEFHAGDETSIPKECRHRHGARFRYDDPIWNAVPSCGHPECCCWFSVVIDR